MSDATDGSVQLDWLTAFVNTSPRAPSASSVGLGLGARLPATRRGPHHAHVSPSRCAGERTVCLLGRGLERHLRRAIGTRVERNRRVHPPPVAPAGGGVEDLRPPLAPVHEDREADPAPRAIAAPVPFHADGEAKLRARERRDTPRHARGWRRHETGTVASARLERVPRPQRAVAHGRVPALAFHRQPIAPVGKLGDELLDEDVR
jgi:hypothetical protein